MNWKKLSIFLTASKIMPQVFGLRYAKLSVPWKTEWAIGCRNWELCIKLERCWFLDLKISLIWLGDMLLIILCNSMTSICMFLSWLETELSLCFCSNYSNNDFLSFYIIRKRLSWSFFSFSFLLRLIHVRHIHARGQQLNWKLKKNVNQNPTIR